MLGRLLESSAVCLEGQNFSSATNIELLQNVNSSL